MTIQNANAIVQRLGPCRILLDMAAHPGLVPELALAGCEIVDIAAADAAEIASTTVGLLRWTGADPRDFAQAIDLFGRGEALVLETVGQDRAPLEHVLFDAGWQRHPAGMMAHEYAGWSQHALPAVSYYARARVGSGELGMGAQADALIARYAMAANHVRAGDHVLVDGEGTDAGAAILTALSRAGSVARSIEADLARTADNSVDLIVAFEPPVSTGWVARLDDYARVLKHDGRLVLGWRRSPVREFTARWSAATTRAGAKLVFSHQLCPETSTRLPGRCRRAAIALDSGSSPPARRSTFFEITPMRMRPMSRRTMRSRTCPAAAAESRLRTAASTWTGSFPSASASRFASSAA